MREVGSIEISVEFLRSSSHGEVDIEGFFCSSKEEVANTATNEKKMLIFTSLLEKVLVRIEMGQVF